MKSCHSRKHLLFSTWMGFTIDVGIPKFLETAYKNAGMWTTLKAVRRTAPCELQSSLVDDNLLLRPHLDDGHHEHPGRAGDFFCWVCSHGSMKRKIWNQWVLMTSCHEVLRPWVLSIGKPRDDPPVTTVGSLHLKEIFYRLFRDVYALSITLHSSSWGKECQNGCKGSTYVCMYLCMYIYIERFTEMKRRKPNKKKGNKSNKQHQTREH